MLKALAIPLALAAAIAVSSPARATPEQDIDFCNIQRAVGIYCGDGDTYLAASVCTDVWGGVPPEDVARELYSYNSETMTLDLWRAFVAGAIAVYCPPDLSQVYA